MDKIVSIQNLTIEFNRNIEVVKNINLDVIKGKTTAIVGEAIRDSLDPRKTFN